MARRWTDWEYDILFRSHRPIESHAPEPGEVTSIAATIDRTEGAVRAQWDDARSAVLGSKSAASRRLKDYMTRIGWL